MKTTQESVSHSLSLNSIAALSPELRIQYRSLQVYSFIWWGFYSYFLVFQPLYLAKLGFSLSEIFINAALSPVLSLFFENSWSKFVDSYQKIKPFIVLGNIILSIVSFLTIYANSFLWVLLLTIFLRLGPNPDYLTTTLVYRLSDKCDLCVQNDPVEKKFHNINVYALFRRFGSIGWALFLPFMGLLVNQVGLGINFFIASIGFLGISLYFWKVVDEQLILSKSASQPNKSNSIRLGSNKSPSISVPREQTGSLLSSLRSLFNNKLYFGFLVASLLYSVAYFSTYQVQGLFYNLFAHDNYFQLVLIYSIAAAVEFPFMTIIARQVNKIGWEKMIMWVYVFTGIRLGCMPFILLLGGNIFWGYLIQIFTGILFGFRWPTTTFGIYVSLADNQKTIGQTFFSTISLLGTFLGNLLGAILVNLTGMQTDAFLLIHWVAAFIGILSGISFWLFLRKSDGIHK